MPGGQPTKYNEAVAKEICHRLSMGESLVGICQSENMPTRACVYHWLDEAAKEDAPKYLIEFFDRYTRARDLQSDSFFDEAIYIADDSSGDVVEMKRDDGTTYDKVQHEVIQRSKLRVDTRLKVAAVTRPEKYSEKKLMELTGKGGGPVGIETSERPKLTREEWLKLHGFTQNGVD
jgi:hypothetical protein